MSFYKPSQETITRQKSYDFATKNSICPYKFADFIAEIMPPSLSQQQRKDIRNTITCTNTDSVSDMRATIDSIARIINQ